MNNKTQNLAERIIVRGAKVHNLKNISVDIYLNKLTVVTGVSGSGKTSLAFDTIYAEGQRRYVESLSAYARQFLERMDKPDVDEVIGICPAIAISQKNSSRNPRSTVATQTEIFDYLRLFYARIGKTYCPRCEQIVKRDTPESIADQILKLPSGTRFYVVFPALIESETSKTTKGKKDQLKSVQAHLMSLMQRGFTRLYQNGNVIELQTPESFLGETLIGVYVLVDRLAIKNDIRQRLIDSIETCYQASNGQVLICTLATDALATKEFYFSDQFECKSCSVVYPIPEPRLFSFNNPYGACPTCQGFGNTVGVDLDLVIPNKHLSLADNAIEPWSKAQYDWALEELKEFCKASNIPLNVPFHLLTQEQQNLIIQGNKKAKWMGVRGFFEWLETKKYKLHIRVLLSKYRGYSTCIDCGGGRLRQEARNVKVDNKAITEVLSLSVSKAAEFFDKLLLTEMELTIAERLLLEIRRRLRFLLDVGLEYLTLDRLASTLSGGEAQRIQLATNLGSSLVGALYVLDEPSIGLHPRDNERLINILKNLRDIGNTVLVVEHEVAMIKAADYVIDVGLGAGEFGGEIVFEGSLAKMLKQENSLTAKYLRSELEVKIPKLRRPIGDKKLLILGANEHNLKNIDVEIPLGVMTCITGVSGSGKSTLVHNVIYAGLKKERGEWQEKAGACKKIEGGKFLSEAILVDQSPIGRTPRSNPVTYIKVYDVIREVFASTKEAKSHGYDASHFSFNVPGGRCETCQGDGTITVEMQFLADVELVCEECKGTRFKSSLLEIKYRNRNIHEVLQLTVREAMSFFSSVPRISNKLRVLDDVGLGYLRLGQSATTLSGGEAQRVKLASYLAKRTSERTLFIFDEPTTGLHFDDINKLLVCFRRLIDAGATIVIIEHNLDVIKTADWIIDLGPEGGDQGGYIVAKGRPEEIMEREDSYTGEFLREHLQNALQKV
ncbi:MAG: excinuclease ABC subunit UvrA [Acidobacteria bacterium]|nr:excinuclease ABC subunit UvrA [Acidobacteriota bacterium]